MPDRVERVQVFIPALNVQRELLAELAHVTLDGIHADEFRQLLLHLGLRLFELFLGERLGFRAVVLLVFVLLVLATTTSTSSWRALPTVQSLFQRLSAHDVLETLLLDGLAGHRILLVLQRGLKVLGSFDILVHCLGVFAGCGQRLVSASLSAGGACLA